MSARDEERAHGVTPGLSADYAARTAERQAAFLVPRLRPGIDLLDVGCGPGTITLGLARAVAPGSATGIDHDAAHVDAASALATEREISNACFLVGDALSLPFEDETFDAAFENNVFIHISEDAVRAAEEVLRVLKPAGLFAARDADAEAVVWGNANDSTRRLDELMIAWQRSRGSDVTLGKRLPSILREAGFVGMVKSVSADTKGDPAATHSHAGMAISLLEGPLGEAIAENGWAEEAEVERLKEGIREWGEHPDAFFANVHVEVVGQKPHY